jgi:hypothetical protein
MAQFVTDRFYDAKERRRLMRSTPRRGSVLSVR